MCLEHNSVKFGFVFQRLRRLIRGVRSAAATLAFRAPIRSETSSKNKSEKVRSLSDRIFSGFSKLVSDFYGAEIQSLPLLTYLRSPREGLTIAGGLSGSCNLSS